MSEKRLPNFSATSLGSVTKVSFIFKVGNGEGINLPLSFLALHQTAFNGVFEFIPLIL